MLTYDQIAELILMDGSTVEGIVVNPMGQDLMMNRKVVDQLVYERYMRTHGGSMHAPWKKKSPEFLIGPKNHL